LHIKQCAVCGNVFNIFKWSSSAFRHSDQQNRDYPVHSDKFDYGINVTTLLGSYLLVFLLVLGFLLAMSETFWATIWTVFAIANGLVFYSLHKTPTYFEKIILELVDRSDQPLSADTLYKEFESETPNLKPGQTRSMFLKSLHRLEKRGLVQLSDGAVYRQL
jgi:hypothetical protein